MIVGKFCGTFHVDNPRGKRHARHIAAEGDRDVYIAVAGLQSYEIFYSSWDEDGRDVCEFSIKLS